MSLQAYFWEFFKLLFNIGTKYIYWKLHYHSSYCYLFVMLKIILS